MPHLSPLNWLTMTIIFWTLLLLFTTTMWWQQTPNFPKQSKKPQTFQKPWNWR